MGGSAVPDLLGGSYDDVTERFQLASPAARLPIGVPQVLIHGTRDDTVPPSMSVEYCARAEAMGDDVTLELLSDVNHMDVISGRGPTWAVTVQHLRRMLETPTAPP